MVEATETVLMVVVLQAEEVLLEGMVQELIINPMYQIQEVILKEGKIGIVKLIMSK